MTSSETVAVRRLSIEELNTYIYCGAKYFSDTKLKEKESLYRKRRRLVQGAVNEMTLHGLGSTPDTGRLAPISDMLHSSLPEKDAKAALTLLENFARLVSEYEMTLTGSVMPFELSYEGSIITSWLDCTVKDAKRGTILPVVVDIGSSRYIEQYNPIAYRCQTIADHLEIVYGTVPPITVISPSTAKRWVFNHKRFGPILKASISEAIRSIDEDFFPVRYGWWCATCDTRGLCHCFPER
jgi:hypothetical protein